MYINHYTLIYYIVRPQWEYRASSLTHSYSSLTDEQGLFWAELAKCMHVPILYKAISSQLAHDVSSEVSFGVEVLMRFNICRSLHFRFMDEKSLGSPSPIQCKNMWQQGCIACIDTATKLFTKNIIRKSTVMHHIQTVIITVRICDDSNCAFVTP